MQFGGDQMNKSESDADIRYADRFDEDSPATILAEKFRQADELIDDEKRTIPPANRMRELAD